MAEEQQETPISREAFDRVKRERDELKTQAASLQQTLESATAALNEVKVRDRVFDHLSEKGVSNPYQVARFLTRDVTDVDSENFPAQVDSLYNQYRGIFGGASPPEPEGEQPPRPAAPMAQPNPTAPGTPPVGGAPLVVGSKEYQERYGSQSMADQRAAVERGEAVFPADVRQAQTAR